MSEGQNTATVLVRNDGSLRSVPITDDEKPAILPELKEKWQGALDLLVHILGISASMITYLTADELQVFLSSQNAENPYSVGEYYPLRTGMYCESVIGNDCAVAMSDAAHDELWCDNPDMAQGMGDYIGVPLHWGDGEFFGTLCLLDNKRISRSDAPILLNEFGAAMEIDLRTLCLLQEQNREVSAYAKTMEVLLQQAPGGIFCYAAEEDDQFTYISNNMLALLGYTGEEFREKFQNRFSLMVWHEDRARVLNEIEEQIAHDAFDNCEYRIERKDGTLVWVHDEGHIVTDEDGRRWYYVVIVDVTQRVEEQERAQERYRQSMQTLLEVNPNSLCSFIINLTRNICGEGQGISPYIEKALLADTADGLFTNIEKMVPFEEDRRKLSAVLDRRALIGRFAEGVDKSSVDYRRNDENGKPFWVRTYLSLLRNPSNDDVEGVIYSLDISKEKRKDEIFNIITNQEFDLVALVHLADDTIEFLSLSPRLLPKYHEKLGKPGERFDYDMIRQFAVASWIAEEDRDRYLGDSQANVVRKELDRNGRYELIVRGHYTGHPDELMCRKIQHYYLGDDRDTVLLIQTDVTETYLIQQRETERAKAEAERVQDIMDSISAGIGVLYMSDPDHLTFAYVNQQMYRLLGFPEFDGDTAKDQHARDELMSVYIHNAFADLHPDDLAMVQKVFHDNFDAPAFTVGPYRTMGGDGQYHWLQQDVRLRETTPEHRVFYATYHDVSEEVHLHKELEQQLETETALRIQADAANVAKSEFLSRISHDIRTPINAITGMTAFAKEDLDCREKVAEDLGKIEDSAKRLLSLINDVLDLSRAESGKIELSPSPYPYNEFIRGIRNMFEPICEQSGQKFIVEDISSDKGVIVDRVRFDQIVMNLLSNAIKYTPTGGTISYLSDSHLRTDGMVECTFTVKDTGIGMSEAFQKRMFEPFSQELDNPARTRLAAGTGLGLSIVKRLVDCMGGTIDVDSAPCRGTAVTVHLTLPAATEEDLARYRSDTCPCGASTKQELSGEVLLVEDNELNVEISVRLLESFGLTVIVAENGMEAVDRFSSSTPGEYRAILMDIQMPLMNGYEASRAIRALPRTDARTTPIIAMSADAFSDDVERCLAAGMDGHIAKPIDPHVLFKTLEEKLDAFR